MTPLDERSASRTDTRAPEGFFFLLFSVMLCPDCPGCAFCPYCTTHNTNIHAFGRIRTGNPSKRAASDSRFRPLGHWDTTLQYCSVIRPFGTLYCNNMSAVPRDSDLYTKFLKITNVLFTLTWFIPLCHV